MIPGGLNSLMMGATSAIPLSGLVAAYDLDSNLVDWVGGLNGTAVSSLSYAAGAVGNAISGDGVNYATLPNLGVSGSSARTISFVYKRGATSSIKSALGWGVVAAKSACIAHIGAASAGDIYWSFNSRDYYTAGSQVNTSTFTHVVLRYSGGSLSTSSVNIIVNNILKPITQTGVSTGLPSTTDDNYTLMTDIGDLSGRISDGKLDLVRIYNRSLSDSEITQLYNEAFP